MTKQGVRYRPPQWDEGGGEHLSVTLTPDESIDDVVRRLVAEGWIFQSVNIPCVSEIVEGKGYVRKKPGPFRWLHFYRNPDDPRTGQLPSWLR